MRRHKLDSYISVWYLRSLLSMAKKVAKAPKEETLEEEVEHEETSNVCEHCGGRGLLDQDTLCTACEGSGRN